MDYLFLKQCRKKDRRLYAGKYLIKLPLSLINPLIKYTLIGRNKQVNY